VKLAGIAFALSAVALAGCAAGLSALAPATNAHDAPAHAHALPYGTPTPDPNHLYVDHNGTFSVYALPLDPASKPLRSLPEASPGALPPQIAADQFGNVALATPTQILLYNAPITSFAPKRARMTIPLTPAITQLGASGADLTDLEFDPNENLWLLNNYGGGSVAELQAPLTKYEVASAVIGFGVAGTKTASYGSVRQARFDVNSNLFVYATQTQGSFSLLFKSGFPYDIPPSGVDGLDLSTPDYVDPTQWNNGPPTQLAGGLLLGQYNGLLASPAPGHSPPPNSQVLAQFDLPILPVKGVFPSNYVNDVVAALVADPNRSVFYTLRAADGALEVYGIPLSNGAKPHFVIPCAARLASLCSNKPEHLFLAP
jgi:hypothetical protein